MLSEPARTLRPPDWLQALRAPALQAPVRLHGWRDIAMQVALAALGVVLPFSSAGVSVALGAIVLLAVCSAPQLWRTAAWREPVAMLGLLLFAYILLHTVITAALTGADVGVVNKYHELLLFPLLLAAMVAISRPEPFVWGLAAGCVGYALAHWATVFEPALAEELARRRISAGFCLAVTAHVFLHLGGRRAWIWRLIAALLAITVLLRIDGRTGQVILLVLATLAVWRRAPGHWRHAALVGVPLALLTVALLSPPVKIRMMETVDGLATLRLDTGTSTSIRLALLINSWTVATSHQPLGVGFSRFAEFHEPVARQRLAREPAWKPENASWEVLANNPHNEYLMQLAGGGAAALALFLAWLAAPALRRDRNGRMSPALSGVVLAFAVACLFNSLLMDFTEGHFYMAMLAWLLAHERRHAVASEAP